MLTCVACALPAFALVLSIFSCTPREHSIFALYERKNETQKKIQYCGSRAGVPAGPGAAEGRKRRSHKSFTNRTYAVGSFLPSAERYFLLLVCGFSAPSAEKPHTYDRSVPCCRRQHILQIWVTA